MSPVVDDFIWRLSMGGLSFSPVPAVSEPQTRATPETAGCAFSQSFAVRPSPARRLTVLGRDCGTLAVEGQPPSPTCTSIRQVFKSEGPVSLWHDSEG